jgi:putative CocE/NonD family hydrolase
MTTLSIDMDTGMAMSDGVVLRSDVIRPSGPGRHPALIFRTPYDRSTFASVSLQVHALRMARAGYAVVLQDVRGRFGSPGVFEPFVNEQSDGVDTIHGVAEQPWCDGKVGTVGISYNGFSQIATAAAAPEPLAAWIPGLTPFDVRRSWIREGDVFNYGFNLAWMLGSIGSVDKRTPDPAALIAAFSDPFGSASRRPTNQPELTSAPVADAFFAWLGADDPYPGDSRIPAPGGLGDVAAPALVVAGWFDIFQPGSLDLFDALGAETAELGHRLVAGPWDHSGLPFKRRAGDRDHGIPAMLDYHALQRGWFDAHLRGADLPESGRDIFVTGSNRWEDLGGWPPPGETRSWDLNPDGTMSTTGHGGEVAITLDIDDPTPALGGRPYPWEPLMRSGSFDQRPREERADVAVFTSEPLEHPVRAIGSVTVETVVVPETHGTDVTVTVSDVDAAGVSWNVADGIRRVRGASGEMLNARVSLGSVAHEFSAGHRIRVSLAAAAFPRYDMYGGSGTRVFLTGPGYSRLRVTEVA